MDLVGIMPIKISQRKKSTILFHLCMEYKKIKMKKKMTKHNKTETDLQIQRTNRWLPEWREVNGAKKWVREIKRLFRKNGFTFKI